MMEAPKDLVDCLNDCQLSFLVPKQEIIHLFSPRGIQLPSPTLPSTDPSLNQIRKLLDTDTSSQVAQLTDSILNDFDEVDMPELNLLKFRKPAMRYNRQGSYQPLHIGGMDQQILNKLEDVVRSDLVKPDLKMKRIKLNYERHRELDMKYKAEQEERKRKLEQEKEKEASTPLAKKIKISPHPPADKALAKSSTGLTNLVDRIGLTDSDLDITIRDLWFPLSEGDDFEGILSNEILDKIDDYVLKLSESDETLMTVDIKYLVRVQNLCGKSLKKCGLSDLGEIVNLGDDTHQKYRIAINGARASLIVMRLFLSKRPEKQLYLDTYLNLVVDFLNSLLEDVIVPLSKLVVSDDRLELMESFVILQRMAKQVLALITDYLLTNNLDEGLITRLEYLSSTVIFAEINNKHKTSIVSVSMYESLRMTCCDVICAIFHTRDDQRQFILDEVLVNMDKLPTHKSHARQLKLSRGVNVQAVSILLVRLIQNFSLSDFEGEIDHAMPESWEELSKTQKKAATVLQEEFSAFVTDRSTEMLNVANQVASALLNKFIKNIDTNSKHVFEILLQDLLNIVPFPEWSGAETLLVTFMKTLIYICETSTYSAASQRFALEMVGSIGGKILQLKAQREPVNLTSNMSLMDFMNVADDYIECLTFLSDVTKPHSNNSFQFLLLKMLKNLNELAFTTKPQNESPPSRLFIACSDLQRRLIMASVQEKLHTKAGRAIDSNADEASVTVYKRVLLSQDLLHLYDSFLNLVMKSLDHSKIKSRTTAIKNLSALVAREPSVLTLKPIETSITARLDDSSAQVRDAVIELIGQFIGSKPEMVDDYYKALCEKMDDTSIAVRKRAMKLSKDIYSLSKKKEVRSLIAEKLLGRLEDEEDTVIELARITLLEFWFLSLADEVKIHGDIHSIHIVVPIIDVILEVIGKNDRNWDFFTMFLTEHALVPDERDPPELHDKVMEALQLIIDKTLNFIIASVDNLQLKKKVERAMGLLSVITQVDGKLITQDQLIRLKPYLTDESSTGSSVCYYTLSIFRHALPQANHLNPSFIRDSLLSLLKRLTTFNVKELGEAMPCAWILSTLQKDTVRMATAALSCLKLIRPFLDNANKGELDEVDPKLTRLLFLIGNFGKYCDFNLHSELFRKANVGLGCNEPVVSVFVKFLFCFAADGLNHQVRRTAIKNLVYVCSSHAKLFMATAMLNLLDKELKGSETDIKAAIIQELIEFLQQEDALNLKKTSKRQTRNTKLDISVLHGNSASYITDGICASLVQRYMEPILQITLAENGGYSILAAKYLQLVVKLGFANPKLCMPTIIALESSHIFALRSRAIGMHTALFEKHETLIESSYVEGIKLGFEYRKRVSQNYLQENSFLKTVYQVIGGSRTARKKLITSLAKLITSNLDDFDASKFIYSKEFMMFVLNNLAHVEFSDLEEVYTLCHAIDKALSVEGVNLSLQISESMDSDLRDEGQWESFCIRSQYFLALLRFRDFLFQTYGLHEDKARDFQPNKVDRDLRTAPKIVKEVAFKLNDLFIYNRQDYQQTSMLFVRLLNDVQHVV